MSTRLGQEAILNRLTAEFGEWIVASGEHADQMYAVVPREHIIEVLTFLRNDPALLFEQLLDVTVVDHLYLETPEISERFAVVYQLGSLSCGHRFRLKTPVPEDDPQVPSACAIWKAALWGEREAHDMFGVEFDGNPDLRRLLMPANYEGFPLQKNYPLRGRGEREAFTQIRRTATTSEAEASEGPATETRRAVAGQDEAQ